MIGLCVVWRENKYVITTTDMVKSTDLVTKPYITYCGNHIIGTTQEEIEKNDVVSVHKGMIHSVEETPR